MCDQPLTTRQRPPPTVGPVGGQGKENSCQNGSLRGSRCGDCQKWIGWIARDIHPTANLLTRCNESAIAGSTGRAVPQAAAVPVATGSREAAADVSAGKGARSRSSSSDACRKRTIRSRTSSMRSSKLAGVILCQREVAGQLALEVAHGAGGGKVDRWHRSSFWTGFVARRSCVICYVKCHFRPNATNKCRFTHSLKAYPLGV
jgi:hypothetical protein